ncbi:MAG: sulfatase-like hydrolase/transferase, partial [Candidatus Omnitrophica bacterium]|nr:sulfatase-like hydrolase/transferase [Candidatus Omnitrophota bacterium]
LTFLQSAGYLPVIFGRTDHLSGRHSLRARVSAWTRSAWIRRPNYRMPLPRVKPEEDSRVHLSDWQQVEKSLVWLSQNAQDSQPFFLSLGFSSPHPPFFTSAYYWKKINRQTVALPPFDLADHPVLKQQRICKNWEHGFAPELVKQVRTVYLAMVSEVDAMMGYFLKKLRELSLADSTVLIFCSDHGELALEHQQYYKMSPYEGSSRVPLIISGPGIPRGKIVDWPVSLVDIFPTLMDLAENSGPDYLDGHSLIPICFSQDHRHPEWVLAECHDSSLATGCFMLRKGKWKYVVYVGYQSQLFNLEQDQEEIHNLSEEKPSLVAELNHLLRSLVNYPAVDQQVKNYDRESFLAWRNEQVKAGTYFQNMAKIFSGWDDLSEKEVQPWTGEDEARINRWLKGETGNGCQD